MCGLGQPRICSVRNQLEKQKTSVHLFKGAYPPASIQAKEHKSKQYSQRHSHLDSLDTGSRGYLGGRLASARCGGGFAS